MAFRDDRAAAHHRADALERQLAEAQEGRAELERELAAARAEAAGTLTSGYRLIFRAAGIGFVLVGGGMLAGGIAIEFAPLILFGVTLLFMAIPVFLVGQTLIVVPPGQMAVLSGRRRTDAAGRTVGYRLVLDGRVMRIPVLERVDFMDMRSMRVPLQIRGVYNKSAVRIEVVATAGIRIARAEPYVTNAVERFLGYSAEQIAQVGRETLEGEIRGVIATLSTDELRDREKITNSIIMLSAESLNKLGLELDTLDLVELGPESD